MEANCHADYEALRTIYNRIASKNQIQEHCKVRIPEDWEVLRADLGNFEYLYEELGDGALKWSEGAEKLQSPLADLAERVAPDRIGSERTAFSGRIANRSGDDGKLQENP